MPNPEAEKFFTKGLYAFHQGRTLAALAFFEKAISYENSPLYRSYLAVCIAKERGQVRKAIELCREVIGEEPQNSTLYLNLGRIYLHAGDRPEAARVFREGLRHEENRHIIAELDKLVARKPPVFPFLRRESVLNKYTGMVLTALRLR